MVPFYAYRVIHSNNREFYLATLQSKIRLFFVGRFCSNSPAFKTLNLKAHTLFISAKTILYSTRLFQKYERALTESPTGQEMQAADDSCIYFYCHR